MPPEDLLARMTQVYDEARDTILTTERAWETLDPTIEAAVHEVQTLEEMARALGTAADAELTARAVTPRHRTPACRA